MLQVGRRGRQARTVKSLLDSASTDKENNKVKEESKEFDQSEISNRSYDTLKKFKSDPGVQDVPEKTIVKVEPNPLVSNPVKSSNTPESTNKNGASENIVSQSKLFRPDTVQSTNSAFVNSVSLDAMKSVPLMSGHHNPGMQAMLFPPAFIPVGSVHPMGLPVMHPMAMAPFLMPQQVQPEKEPMKKLEKESAFRPNIQQNSHIMLPPTSLPQSGEKRASQSGSGEKRASVIQKAHQSKPTHLTYFSRENHITLPNTHRSNLSPSSLSESAPMAHTATNSSTKRSYDSIDCTELSIPGHSRPNKSLLFDFESSSKNPKEEVNLIKKSQSASSSNFNSDQPTDLSMKTLKRRDSVDTVVLNGTRDRPGAPQRPVPSNFSIQSLSKSSVHSSSGASSLPHYEGERKRRMSSHSESPREASMFSSAFQSYSPTTVTATPPPAHSHKVRTI